MGLPIDVVAVDVVRAMATTRRSLEVTARTLRYAALEAAAARLDATVVGTGHSRDDQAETVLLRLLRGATTRGVTSIRRRRGLYARPILECRRADLRRYLGARGQAFREDASNANPEVPRNRLRMDLLPVVERDWPGGVAALARFAELAGDDERWLSELAANERGRMVRTVAGGVELNRGLFASLAPPVARRVVRDAIEAAGGTASFRDVEAVRRLAAGSKRRGQLDLHAIRVERIDDAVWLGAPTPTRPASGFEYSLGVPGEVRIVETCWSVRASFFTGADRPTLSEGWDAVAVAQASSLALPLTIRNRRPGDRFTPLGAPGSKKVQDLLGDRKVPTAERATVPLLVDAAGRIVWVAGVAMANRCRVRAPESGMVILESKKGKL
jgi:tRNA(Ile)-lysidine synthase